MSHNSKKTLPKDNKNNY